MNNHTKKFSRILMVIALLLASVAGGEFVMNSSEAKSDVKVYVCKGPNAKRYHKSPDCRGLKSCSVVIKKVSRTETIDMGRTLCKRCY